MTSSELRTALTGIEMEAGVAAREDNWEGNAEVEGDGAMDKQPTSQSL
jgi:hypothetical protein